MLIEQNNYSQRFFWLQTERIGAVCAEEQNKFFTVATKRNATMGHCLSVVWLFFECQEVAVNVAKHCFWRVRKWYYLGNFWCIVIILKYFARVVIIKIFWKYQKFYNSWDSNNFFAGVFLIHIAFSWYSGFDNLESPFPKLINRKKQNKIFAIW